MEQQLSKFKQVGFFGERDAIIQCLNDFFQSANRHQIRACIMFGTLLGKIRHNDFIPWDDDVDIVIFDFLDFMKHCAPELTRQGYTVEPDIRDGKSMGCRVFRKDGAAVPGKPNLRFPWIGVWEHQIDSGGMIVLPPEEFRYEAGDFLPLKHVDFLGVRVGVPRHSTNILNAYFGSNDWMEVCQLPYRDHRNGGELTGYSTDKFNLEIVLEYLTKQKFADETSVDTVASDFGSWKYPTLAKPESDGAYCYHVQRRISARISVQLAQRMTPNVATAIDLIIAVVAAACVARGYWSLGAIFIQLFGIFSCVDGELARIQGTSSKLGDFLDTMTDRVAELLLLAALGYSLGTRIGIPEAMMASLALLGGVFLLTVSSEKFRSTFQTAYPKKRFERFFSLCSAGSDARILILSAALIVGDISGQASLLLGTVWILATATYANFVLRIWKVHQEFGDARVIEP